MKTVTFMKRQRGNVTNDNVLHIEVPGAIINVYIDLYDAINDRKVTRVEIKADDYAGEEWRIEDGNEMLTSMSARVISVPGYRRQQQEIAEKMKIEASHMEKIDPDLPRVGMGATLCYPQDRYPYVVAKVISPTHIIIKRLVEPSLTTGDQPRTYRGGSFPVWDKVYTEADLADPKYACDPNDSGLIIHKNKKGLWVHGQERTPVILGTARYYRDYSD